MKAIYQTTKEEQLGKLPVEQSNQNSVYVLYDSFSYRAIDKLRISNYIYE